MLFRGLDKAPSGLEISGNFLVGLDLRGYQSYNLFHQVLWYANDTIEICNQIVSRADRGTLVFSLELDTRIDLRKVDAFSPLPGWVICVL